MQRTELTRRTARNKGLATLAAGVGTGLMLVFGPWWLGVVGVGVTGYYGYRWLRYRGQWGMRF